MTEYKLNKCLKFRLEKIETEDIIFCYDERINEYFAMNSKYFEVLKLLENYTERTFLIQNFRDINIDLLLRGLMYRTLLDIKNTGESDHDVYNR